MKINKLISMISEVLGIHEPQIDYNEKFLSTNTMLAAVSFPDKIIHIRKRCKNSYDLYLAIAHEMRHIWQYDNSEYRKLFDDYKHSLDNLGEYNKQALEIDAHAFSIIVMTELFGVKPTFENVLDQQTIKAINERISEIYKDELKRKP